MFIRIYKINKVIVDYQETIYEDLDEDLYYQIQSSFNFSPSLDEAVWKHLEFQKFEFIRLKNRELAKNEYVYSDFIDIIVKKELLFRFQFKELNTTYELWFNDGTVQYYCMLDKIIDYYECVDFETKYKTDCNKNVEILTSETNMPIFSPSLEDVQGLYPKKKMYKNTVVAGQLNFFDVVVETEKRICGGEYWISSTGATKVHDDDYIEFSIIDKNDVLGLFATYGLQVGVDVLELCKFVITDYVKKGDPASGYHSQLFEGIKGTNKVIPGLFYRAAYDSHGAENVVFLWRMYYYE